MKESKRRLAVHRFSPSQTHFKTFSLQIPLLKQREQSGFPYNAAVSHVSNDNDRSTPLLSPLNPSPSSHSSIADGQSLPPRSNELIKVKEPITLSLSLWSISLVPLSLVSL